MDLAEKNIQLFKTILEQTPISTQIFTPDGKTVWINKAWEDLWNAKYEQLEEYNILKDKQLVQTGVMPYIKRGFKGELVNIPAIYYDPTKTLQGEGLTPRWLSARMYPITDNTGKIIFLVLQHEDITDRKISEENLKESQERLQATWEVATDAMALSDSNGIVIDANAAYIKLYGFRKEEVIGKPFSIIFPAKFRKLADEEYKKRFTGKATNALVETSVVSKNGKEHIVESRYSFLLRNSKRVAMLSVIRDVSVQKKSEADLKESEVRFRTLADQSPMFVYIVEPDKAANMSYFNKTWLDYTGETFKKALGRSWDEVVHPDDYKGIMDAYVPAFKARDAYTVEARIKRYDGEYRWHTFKGVPRYSPDGKFSGFIGVGFDIHERKLYEETLRYQKSLLEAQQEASPLGILVVSSDGRMLVHNQRFSEIWKFPKKVMDAQLDDLALKSAQKNVIDPDEFIERVEFLYTSRQKGYDKIYFKDGRIFDRYGSPVISETGEYYG